MKPDESARQAPASAAGASASPALAIALRVADSGAAALVAALAHVLQQNDWARARLVPFTGHVVRIGVDAPALPGLPPPQLLAQIVDGGLLGLVPWPSDGEPDIAVHMLFRPSIDAAFAWLREGPTALPQHLRIEGEVALAGALGEVARHLRWDVEEDVSRVAGDALARRIAGAVEGGRAAARDLRARVETAAIGRVAGDTGPLVAGGELAALRAALDALESRIVSVEARGSAVGAGPRSAGKP